MAPVRYTRPLALIALVAGCGGRILDDAPHGGLPGGVEGEDGQGRADGASDATAHDARQNVPGDETSGENDASAGSDAQSVAFADGGSCYRLLDGDPSHGYVLQIDVAAAGSGFVAAGAFSGSINFGSGPKTSFGTALGLERDVFVAKYDSTCHPSWVKTFGLTTLGPPFGASADESEYALAVDSAGNVLIGGASSDGFPVGPTQAPAGSFLVKLDPDGAPVWATGFGRGVVRSIDADAADDLIVTASFQEGTPFGEEIYQPVAVVAKFTSAGMHVWHRTFAPFDQTWPNRGAHVRKDGRVVLGASSTVEDQAFIVSLDANGNTLWSRTVTATAAGAIQIHDLRTGMDAAGHVVLASGILGTVDFGGGAITATRRTPTIVKYDSAGNQVFARMLASPPCLGAVEPAVSELHVADSGEIHAAGTACGGSIDFGNGPVAVADDQRWAAVFDATGVVQSSRVLGTGGAIASWHSGTDALLLAGYVSHGQTLDLGLGPVSAVGSVSGFVARLPPLP